MPEISREIMKQKQKIALEKVTGKPWDSWNPEAVRAYFAFTDRGQRVQVPPEARVDYDELYWLHKTHALDVASWKEDFRFYLLTLEDFINESPPPPDNYLRHVFELYRDATGYIPKQYAELADRLGVDRLAGLHIVIERIRQQPQYRWEDPWMPEVIYAVFEKGKDDEQERHIAELRKECRIARQELSVHMSQEKI